MAQVLGTFFAAAGMRQGTCATGSWIVFPAGFEERRLMSVDKLKHLAAEKALTFVERGMKLGLGTGSTAAIFVELLGAKVGAGLDVVCVPTSEATRLLAARLGIRLTTLDADPILDLVVDGADEIDVDLQLIKGGGGALLREKIVASASNRMVVIADVSKKVTKLGRVPLPIEVVPFGVKSTTGHIAALAGDAGCTGRIDLRLGADGRAFVTDGGNFILDCAFQQIDDPESLAEALQVIPGVVEHGLFLGLADMAIIGGAGGVEVLHAKHLADD